ncbi:MAG: D-alanine--D-alanine ligase [Acidobacteria bacterium]|nr:D-alanine--D-alanine ligase [Acidobacteriota bacterium]
MRRLRIGIVYGGRSGEHEVSLASAAAIFANLDRKRYDPVPIRISRDGGWSVADRPPGDESAAKTIGRARAAPRAVRDGREVHPIARPGDETLMVVGRTVGPPASVKDDGHALAGTMNLDAIFPIVHGPYGEDGTLQGLLELADIPYVGAGVVGAAAGMDKAVMKALFAAAGLPIVKHETVLRRAWRRDREKILADVSARLDYPLFVKPANLGSSLGISRAADQASLASGIDHAAEFDRKIIVEEGVVPCREIECAVLGNDEPEASVPGEIVPAGDFYDYEAKYLDDRSRTIVPADLAPREAERIRAAAVEAFRAIDCAGMARVDFLLDRGGRIFLNEINTHPGFTTISMFAKLWEASGVGYPSLLDRLIELALERHAERRESRIGGP